ncbi:hypothetical protein [Psychrobacillus sp. L3]
MTNIKDVLQSIISGDLKFVSSEVLNEMIENIGSTNPILRTTLFTALFVH